MVVLAFETSAKAVSVALLQDGALLGEYYQNSGQTHSRTMMKLAQDLLENCDRSVSDIDYVAYANGPGSFTGIRIGAAAAKGFCWGAELPCLPVSTLEAMAYGAGREGIVCACMDARRQQVYNALFEISDGQVCRLTPDRAISLEVLAAELKKIEKFVFLVGDGGKLCYNSMAELIPGLCLAPEHLRQQRAAGVALAGAAMVNAGLAQSAFAATPNYLRLSQAERERLEREQTKGE